VWSGVGLHPTSTEWLLVGPNVPIGMPLSVIVTCCAPAVAQDSVIDVLHPGVLEVAANCRIWGRWTGTVVVVVVVDVVVVDVLVVVVELVVVVVGVGVPEPPPMRRPRMAPTRSPAIVEPP
jgi:hypothetical protein